MAINPKNLERLLEISQNQLGLTFQASDSLDTKALGILAFDVAILIFTLQSEIDNPWWLLTPLFGLFTMSMLCAIKVFWPSDYQGPVVDIRERNEYLDMPNPSLLLQLLADTKEAIDSNNEQNTTKSISCITAIMLSLIGTCFLVGCII